MRKTKRSFGPGGLQVGQDSNIPLPAAGDVVQPEIVVPDGPIIDDYAKDLAFMEEPVTIQIDSEESEFAENPVQVGVNGSHIFIWRDQLTIIKRKFLESLLRAKPTSIRTKVTQRGAGADPGNEIIRKSGLRYPVHIVEDKNPNGFPWYRKILAEG